MSGLPPIDVPDVFGGIQIAITGPFSRSRDFIREMIQFLGGEVVNISAHSVPSLKIETDTSTQTAQTEEEEEEYDNGVPSYMIRGIDETKANSLAKNLSIPIVNERWLFDCLQYEKVMPTEPERYHEYSNFFEGVYPWDPRMKTADFDPDDDEPIDPHAQALQEKYSQKHFIDPDDPFSSLVLVLCGRFKEDSKIVASKLEALGASVKRAVTDTTTHLIITRHAYQDKPRKLSNAKFHDAKLVSSKWIKRVLATGNWEPIESFYLEYPENLLPPRKRHKTVAASEIIDIHKLTPENALFYVTGTFKTAKHVLLADLGNAGFQFKARILSETSHIITDQRTLNKFQEIWKPYMDRGTVIVNEQWALESIKRTANQPLLNHLKYSLEPKLNYMGKLDPATGKARLKMAHRETRIKRREKHAPTVLNPTELEPALIGTLRGTRRKSRKVLPPPKFNITTEIFKNMNIFLLGKFDHRSSKIQLKHILMANGATVLTNISSKVTVCIADPSLNEDSKMFKTRFNDAHDLSIPILSEDWVFDSLTAKRAKENFSYYVTLGSHIPRTLQELFSDPNNPALSGSNPYSAYLQRESGLFNNLSLSLVGRFETNLEHIVKIIRSHGGKYVRKIHPDVHYIVVGKNMIHRPTKQLRDATSYPNVEIVNEQWLLHALKDQSLPKNPESFRVRISTNEIIS